ncbi:hypothetical protein WA026_010059 [Henosepilachna vigintioctopunctata]|uniref:Uncharacterized protein n=1 Tax=Henosepilachna vigintioctopunctata TaxID=420089 RepID=A0AAW1UKB1_9CUCU
MRANSYILMIVLLNIFVHFSPIRANSRGKRLVFLPGADKIQVIVGVGIPAYLERETVIFGVLFKGNYAIPSNATQLSPVYTTYQRGKRSALDYYKGTIDLLERHMQLGKDCTLRAICETAIMAATENHGLIAEIVETILSYMQNKVVDIEELEDSSHVEAFKQGIKSPHMCASVYKKCKIAFSQMATEK